MKGGSRYPGSAVRRSYCGRWTHLPCKGRLQYIVSVPRSDNTIIIVIRLYNVRASDDYNNDQKNIIN